MNRDELIRKFLELKEQDNIIKKQIEKLKKEIMSLAEAYNGKIVGTNAIVEIKERKFYTWNVEKVKNILGDMSKLVIKEEIDDKKMKKLLKSKILSEQIKQAKEVSKTVKVLSIKEI